MKRTSSFGKGTSRDSICLLFSCILLLMNGRSDADQLPRIEIRRHLGRPMIFLEGKPHPMAAYSPAGHWRSEVFEQTVPRFFPHRINAYFIEIPMAKTEPWDFFSNAFWVGDTIEPKLLTETYTSLDQQAETILAGDPDTYLILRLWNHEPQSWRALHPDQLVVNEAGQTLPVPSLASERFWNDCARVTSAIVTYCQSRPWAHRLIGYANFMRVEGSHEPLIEHWLYDHSPLMTARWRQFLKDKYETDAALQQAYGDTTLTLQTIAVPTDKLRGTTPEVSALLYWQDAAANKPLRDYLELSAHLVAEGFRRIAAAGHAASTGNRFFIYDTFKQKMMGWSNSGFFSPTMSWPLAFPDSQSGSGLIDVAKLLDIQGFDGLITPHDYQARGLGGVFEPEGMADSMVLRGKLFFAEMDTRTYTGKDALAPARDDKEFAAITWRNIASALSRGYVAYWMDLHEDWFATDSMQQIIAKQVRVIQESVNWPHHTPPGIALIIDDAAAMETNGDGRFFNEAIMWEQKMGLARCGVPFRIYLLQDLELDNFPRHRVFYFPNLFRVDDSRLELLRRKVFRDGNVVVWGPGSGISDGSTISADSASRLTGFQFEMLPMNYPRRTLIANFEHPITRNLPSDTIMGGPLAYGPVLYPTDGTSLSAAWTKYGRNLSGLSVKTFGRGARSSVDDQSTLGLGDWASIFTTAVPIPADLWRGIARFAGAHGYCEDNDVLMAGGEILAVHSLRSGQRTLSLPHRSDVYDLVEQQWIARGVKEIRFHIDAPQTRLWRVVPQD